MNDSLPLCSSDAVQTVPTGTQGGGRQLAAGLTRGKVPRGGKRGTQSWERRSAAVGGAAGARTFPSGPRNWHSFASACSSFLGQVQTAYSLLSKVSLNLAVLKSEVSVFVRGWLSAQARLAARAMSPGLVAYLLQLAVHGWSLCCAVSHSANSWKWIFGDDGLVMINRGEASEFGSWPCVSVSRKLTLRHISSSCALTLISCLYGLPQHT